MSRLPILRTDEMSAEQFRVAEDIRTGRRAEIHGDFVPTAGPMNAWLRVPAFASLAERMGVYCRFEMSLDRRLSELCILVVARHFEAAYEFDVHARIAEDAGIAHTAIEAMTRGEVPQFQAADEDLVFRFAHELITRKKVGSALYREALGHFGESGVVEIVGLLGYYSLVSLTLNAFDAHG